MRRTSDNSSRDSTPGARTAVWCLDQRLSVRAQTSCARATRSFLRTSLSRNSTCAMTPARPLVRRSRCGALRPSATLGLGFRDEDDAVQPAQQGSSVVLPPSALYGLTSFQMEALGLTGEEVARRVVLSEVCGATSCLRAFRVSTHSLQGADMNTSLGLARLLSARGLRIHGRCRA